ncbi:hypothetical protein [Saccharopolyspora hattusasensis]|uniref:hypothetical protein n=1 Tax=Saccharopolyspora hattusasensis TaxID=1128679 RepID=UPI003D9545FF
MAVQVGVDGFALLQAVHGDQASVWRREIPAAVILRTVWIKQYHRTINNSGQEVAWGRRKTRERICSPYAPDARFAIKRGCGWEGCKIHVTETCDDAVTGRPHLVTNVASADATGTPLKR